MIKITNENFSLAQICQSGQCFRMEELSENRFQLISGGDYLEAKQEGEEVLFFCSEEEFGQIWKGYFDLDRDYRAVIAGVDPEDEYLKNAAAFGSGIRILKQDIWEMIISFIISQQNNITRIRRCIRLLCETYGRERKTENGVVYRAFPEPERLAGASIEELFGCNLGYRSRYVKETAGSIAAGELDLKKLPAMGYEGARKELLKLRGVGEKVADCICLFALHHMDAFPRDTHINQALARQYAEGFPFSRYSGTAGILQQYIFYYELHHTYPQV